jgi:hypothetical protein
VPEREISSTQRERDRGCRSRVDGYLREPAKFPNRAPDGAFEIADIQLDDLLARTTSGCG